MRKQIATLTDFLPRKQRNRPMKIMTALTMIL